MFKRMLFLLMVLSIIIVPMTAAAGVHFQVKGGGRLAGLINSSLSVCVGNSSTTYARGGVGSASLPIYVVSRHAQSNSTEIVYEGGFINFGQSMSGTIYIAPEFDRPVKMMHIEWADGRKATFDPPRMVFFRHIGVRALSVNLNPQWCEERLTITVTYCDAGGVIEDPQVYTYTVLSGNR